MAKSRLDVIMVKKGLIESREKAKALIMAGQVRINGVKVDKAGTNIDEEATIEIVGRQLPYVSRGGLKLEKALNTFPIMLAGKLVADIGASTGGFTDCALQRGAQKVYAIDVGYGQLAWKLRNDPRVINMERTNARYLTFEDLGEYLDFISIDVAFISLERILPAAEGLLHGEGEIIALIKPQFEAGKDKVGKKGVVKDPLVHLEVINKIINRAKELNLYPKGLTFSPVKGPEGNIEYLIWLSKESAEGNINPEAIVDMAFQQLNDKG